MTDVKPNPNQSRASSQTCSDQNTANRAGVEEKIADFHKIEGPNGMCHCGVYDGKTVRCVDLLKDLVSQAVAQKEKKIRGIVQNNRGGCDCKDWCGVADGILEDMDKLNSLTAQEEKDE